MPRRHIYERGLGWIPIVHRVPARAEEVETIRSGDYTIYRVRGWRRLAVMPGRLVDLVAFDRAA